MVGAAPFVFRPTAVLTRESREATRVCSTTRIGAWSRPGTLPPQENWVSAQPHATAARVADAEKACRSAKFPPRRVAAHGGRYHARRITRASASTKFRTQ